MVMALAARTARTRSAAIASAPRQVMARRTTMFRNTAYTWMPLIPLQPERYWARGIFKMAWIMVPFFSVFAYVKFYLWRFSA